MWKFAIAVVALSACADPTLEGTYEGKSTAGDFPPTWKLTIAKQTPAGGDAAPGEGSIVEGSWSISGIMIEASGPVSGTFADPDLTLTFTSETAAHCGYNVTATWTGDDIDGTYAAMVCYVTAEGSFKLSRQ